METMKKKKVFPKNEKKKTKKWKKKWKKDEKNI